MFIVRSVKSAFSRCLTSKRDAHTPDAGSLPAASPSDNRIEAPNIPLGAITSQPMPIPGPTTASTATVMANSASATAGASACPATAPAIPNPDTNTAIPAFDASKHVSTPAAVSPTATLSTTATPVSVSDPTGHSAPFTKQARRRVQGTDDPSGEDHFQNQIQQTPQHQNQDPSQLCSIELFSGANVNNSGAIVNNVNITQHDQAMAANVETAMQLGLDIKQLQFLQNLLNPIDFADRYHDSCMKDTRVSIIQEVDKWMFDSTSSNVCWLLGAPGAGKSAIAESTRSKLVNNHSVYMAFFAFRRTDAATSNPISLWRTLAFQLGQYWPDYALQLSHCKQLPSFADQFDQLIKQPLQQQHYYTTPMQKWVVIIIDALDEGISADERFKIQHMLKAIQQWPELPTNYKLLITSRDETGIQPAMNKTDYIIRLKSGKDCNNEAHNDIKQYLDIQFTDIRKQHAYLDAGWPDENIISDLAAEASGLFIWATTAIQIITDGDIKDNLELVQTKGLTLSQLYITLLQKKVNQSVLNEYKTIIGMFLLSQERLHEDILEQFEQCLKCGTNKAKYICNQLKPVLTISQGCVYISHESFADFVKDAQQANEYVINTQLQERNMAIACLTIMRDQLHFDMYKYPSSFMRNNKIEKELLNNVSRELKYACMYWSYHLLNSQSYDKDIQELVQNFINQHVPFWLEVISMENKIEKAIKSMANCYIWCKDIATEVAEMCLEWQQSIHMFSEIISRSLPQIYLSCMICIPEQSNIYKYYRKY
ncbi:hypothetical protein AX16_009287, partial [Volvariella volvacea WC 439]